MKSSPPLTPEQLAQARAICDHVCETLEDDAADECECNTNEHDYPEEVWDHAIEMLGQLGWSARREGARVVFRKS